MPNVTLVPVVTDIVDRLPSDESWFVLKKGVDDELLSGALQRLRDALRHPGVGLVHGWRLELDQHGRISRTAFRRQRAERQAESTVVHPIRLYRREALNPSGTGVVDGFKVVGLAEFTATRVRSIRGRSTDRDVSRIKSGRPWRRVIGRAAGLLVQKLYETMLPHLAWWPLPTSRAPQRTPHTPQRVAFCTWQFPVLSQTFVHREIAALAATGIDLRVIVHERLSYAHADEDALSVASSVRELSQWDRAAFARAIMRWYGRAPLRFISEIMLASSIRVST